MATRAEQNNIFFDANGIARPAAEVGADANSAQKLTEDGTASKPRRQPRAVKIDENRFPHLAAHVALKLPKEPGGRPVSRPFVAPKDAEGTPTRDLSPLEELHNTIALNAASEYDQWKSEQPAASTGGPKTVFVREHPTAIPSPSRTGDRKPSIILREYEQHHRILSDHHAALADVASRDPEMAAVHSEIGGMLKEQGDKIAQARALYSAGSPQVGNEQLLELARKKSLTNIHAMLRHPLMTELHPQGLRPNLDPARVAQAEDEASRLGKETFRRQGKPFKTLNTGERQTAVTADLVAQSKALEKAGVVGSANTAALKAAWKGTARVPKIEQMEPTTVDRLKMDEEGNIVPTQAEEVLPVNIPGTTRPGDARVGSERPAVGRGRGASTRGAGVGGTSAEKPIDPRKRPERLGRGLEGVGGKKRIINISGGSSNLGNPESAIDKVDKETAAKAKRGKKGKKGNK